MEAPKKKKPGINMKAFKKQVEKMKLIDSYIEAGKEIPAELSKNFVTFPLTDDPYSKLE